MELEGSTFRDLPLSEKLQESLATCGFYTPSPIQAKGLPVALFGNDLIAQAKSGMGKTLVFSCVSLELMLRNSTSWALILAPTREIALQIQQVISTLIIHIETLDNTLVVSCIGGLSIQDDDRRLQLKSTRIIVGTPGRVKALVQKKSIPMDYIHLFVLDEVDKLMESDFKSDIDYIIERLPSSKQVVVCSATFTPEQLARLGRFMQSPQFVQVQGPQSVTTEYIEKSSLKTWRARDSNQQPELWLRGVRQYYSTFEASDCSDDIRSKIPRLTHLLTEISFVQCIIFCNDKYGAEALAAALSSQGYPAACITGSQAQAQRSESMENFRLFHARILVSTDLIARGIDVDRVNLVINLDLPRDPATYLHRVGRSGRFGGQGVAVTLLQADEVHAIDALAKLFKMTVKEWSGELLKEDAINLQCDEYATTDLPDTVFKRRQHEEEKSFDPTQVNRVPSVSMDECAVSEQIQCQSIPQSTKDIASPIKQIKREKHVVVVKKTPLDRPSIANNQDGIPNNDIGTKVIKSQGKISLSQSKRDQYQNEERVYEEWLKLVSLKDSSSR